MPVGKRCCDAGAAVKIMFYLNKRAAGKMQIEVILYSNEFGELAKSAGAEKFLQELM